MIPPRSRGTAEEEQKRTSGIKEGFRYVAKDKPSLAMIGLIAATTVFIFPIITVMMPCMRDWYSTLARITWAF